MTLRRQVWELIVGWWRGRRREPLRVEWADKKEDP